MRLDDIRESDDEPKQTHQGGTVKKTSTGVVHTSSMGTGNAPYKKNMKSSDPDAPEKESGRSVNTGSTERTKSGAVHKAGDNYSGKRFKASQRGEASDRKQSSTLNLPDGGKLGGSRNSRLGETTGDPAFDGMMGKIAGSTTPQTAGGAASDKVGASANQPPDAETIEALNKMMYDMHTTMQTANRLMQKLMRGR